MSFNLFEISTQGGRPVGLYEFKWGNTYWRYTSADRVVEFGVDADDNPILYAPIAISDNGVTQGPASEYLEVTLPANIPLVSLFRAVPPSESIWLTIRRFHWGDDEANVLWVGTISNIKRKDRGKALAIGMPISGTIRRTGLRLCFEPNCPHMLYDEGCKASKLDFQNITEITAFDNTHVTVADLGPYAGPQYAGGFVEWQVSAEGTLERRGIEGHIGGNQFAMFGSTDRMIVGLPITMYLGCDLTPETCQGTFNNLANYGGFPFMPKKSPFDGNPVF